MSTPITPMLHVADLAASREFYTRLGFTVVRTNRDFDDDRPINWLLLEHGHSRLMLNAGGEVNMERRDITLSITVNDVDALFAALPEGTVVSFEPRDQFYGRRDFEIRDPSGFSLLFGQPK